MALFRGLGNVGLRAGRGIGSGIKKAGQAAAGAAAVIPATILANSPDFKLLAAVLSGSFGLAASGVSGVKNIISGLKEDFRSDKKSPAVMWLKDIAAKMSALLGSTKDRLKLLRESLRSGKRLRKKKGMLAEEEDLEKDPAFTWAGGEGKPGGALGSLVGIIKMVMKWGKLLKLALLGGLVLLLPTIYQFFKHPSWEKIKKWFKKFLKFLDDHVIPVMSWAWTNVIWPVLEWLGHGLKRFFFTFHEYLEGKRGIVSLMKENLLFLGAIALLFTGLGKGLFTFAWWMVKIVGTRVLIPLGVGVAAAAGGGIWGAVAGITAVAGIVIAAGVALWSLGAGWDAYQKEIEESGDPMKALAKAFKEFGIVFLGRMLNIPADILKWVYTYTETEIPAALKAFEGIAFVRQWAKHGRPGFARTPGFGGARTPGYGPIGDDEEQENRLLERMLEKSAAEDLARRVRRERQGRAKVLQRWKAEVNRLGPKGPERKKFIKTFLGQEQPKLPGAAAGGAPIDSVKALIEVLKKQKKPERPPGLAFFSWKKPFYIGADAGLGDWTSKRGFASSSRPGSRTSSTGGFYGWAGAWLSRAKTDHRIYPPDYPSKAEAMKAGQWATEGGRPPVNLTYAPVTTSNNITEGEARTIAMGFTSTPTSSAVWSMRGRIDPLPPPYML